MYPERLFSGRVFRRGTATNDNLTPRPEDTVAPPGCVPGLSTTDVMPVDARKFQTIEIALLLEPLQAWRDAERHVSITPFRQDGLPDIELLKAWASTRKT